MSAYAALERRDPADLPTGTVTFLYTDVEGSTRLLEFLRDQYGSMLSRHHEILRSGFARSQGVELSNEGDSFFVVFPRAVDAVHCTVEIQRALAAEQWPARCRVRVRMGLHTGEPQIGPFGYAGMVLHRAARIGQAGHGGQALLSKATRELVATDLPPGVSLRDLGLHQLKDINQPERIYQLEIPELQCDFPPLRSLEAEEEPPAPGDPPYKGLLCYTEADEDLFFGREKLVAHLVDRLNEQRFLAIVGASGSGKSSLLRAGVLPALRRAGDSWQIVLVTPGPHPLSSVALALTADLDDTRLTAAAISDMLIERRALCHLAELHRTRNGAARLLLVVDQFEELFTQCRDEKERRSFVDGLIEASRAPSGATTVLLTLRADFYEALSQCPPLNQVVARQQEYIGAMDASELRQAIISPAARLGWQFTPGLVDLILHDLGADADRQPEPGALPLLSHALLETWRRRRRNLMTLRAYFESGGVRGAIARTAERVYGRELSADEQIIARSMFVRLTELGEIAQNTRRRASLHEILSLHAPGGPEQVRDVLEKLAAARLITVGQDSAEVAHEALIREWPTLRDWLNEDREALKLQRHLTEAAKAWEDLGREPGELYRAGRLTQALEWARANPGQVNAEEQAFLDASREAAEREQAERDRARVARERLRRLILVGLTAGLVLALALAGFAAFQWRRAEAQRRSAVFSQLTAEARSRLDAEQYDLALLLGLEAYRSSPGAIARGNLLSLLQQTPYRAILPPRQAAILASAVHPDARTVSVCEETGAVTLLRLSGDQVTGSEQLTFPAAACRSLAFSPDGGTLAVAYDDGSIGLWESATPSLKATLRGGHDGAVTAVAFSPDGRTMASGGADRHVALWSAGSELPRALLAGHAGAITNLAFSPDGRILASGGQNANWNEADNAVLLWDVPSGNRRAELRVPALANVTGLSFQPGGQLLAAGYDNGTVVLWDALRKKADGEPLIMYGARAPTRLAPLPVRVSFGPSGSILAAADGDGAVALWDVATRRPSGGPYHVHTAGVNGLAFASDGRTVITGGDRRVVLWSIGSQIERLIPRPADAQSWAVAFGPDGQTLASGWSDGTIVILGVDGWRPARSMTGLPSGVTTVAFSPAGGSRLLASGGSDGKVVVWDLDAKEAVAAPLAEDAGGVSTVAFSPDGRRLAFAGLDGAVYLRSAPDWAPSPHGSFGGDADSVWGLAFAPDGRTLASGGWDGRIRLWDTTTGKLAAELLAAHDGPVFGLAFEPGRAARCCSRLRGKTAVLPCGTPRSVLSAAHPGTPTWFGRSRSARTAHCWPQWVAASPDCTGTASRARCACGTPRPAAPWAPPSPARRPTRAGSLSARTAACSRSQRTKPISGCGTSAWRRGKRARVASRAAT